MRTIDYLKWGIIRGLVDCIKEWEIFDKEKKRILKEKFTRAKRFQTDFTIIVNDELYLIWQPF